MFRQLLVNLLDNAIKFTQDRNPALIQVSGWTAGHENIYCLKDNGVGFDMRYVQSCLKSFNGCTRKRNTPGPGWVWPSSSGSSTAMGVGCGLKASLAKAPPSVLPSPGEKRLEFYY